MTAERAMIIYRNRSKRSGVDATPEERQFVSEIQAKLPEKRTWIGTLEFIANGGLVLSEGERHVAS